MSENTKIEWCDHTFNPWEGCQKVGPGCDHCYAETRNARFAGGTAINWGPGAPRRLTSLGNWNKPVQWHLRHDEFFKEHGRRQRVFCASLADVFDNAANPEWRTELFALIRSTPNLDWLLLTKRIGNLQAMVDAAGGWPANAQLGITICNQPEANRDIVKALRAKAQFKIPVLFLSMEPLLGPVNIDVIDLDGHKEIYPLKGTFVCEDDDGNPMPDLPAIDWVIVGGESGPGARPMHPDWARSLRDQCQGARVPFHFKQWGEWVPYEDSAQPPYKYSQHGDEIDGHTLPDFETDIGQCQTEWICDWANQILARRVGKKKAGRLLDGVEHNGFPANTLSKDMDESYIDLLENSYHIQCELDEEMSREAFLADYIFCFTTYDSDMGEIFARKALEVCTAINNQTIISYIENEDDYRWFLLMINMPFFAGRLNWGTSIRGAWWNHEGQTLETCGLWRGNEQALLLNFTRHEWKDFIAAMAEFSTETQNIARTA